MVYMLKTKFPKPDDLVMAIIESHDSNGVYVILPEYNNIKGYITYTEVSRKKKDAKKIITIHPNFTAIYTIITDNPTSIKRRPTDLRTIDAGESA